MIVGFASTPVLAGAGVDWLTNGDVRRVLSGEDLKSVANEIAQREFTPHVELSVLHAREAREVTGDLGDRIRAQPGFVYRILTIQVENQGRLDVAVHTHHFSARDASRALHKAELGLTTRFAATSVSTNENAVGDIVFLTREDAQLESLVWQGELANATLALTAPPTEGPPESVSSAPQRPQEKPDP